MRNTNKKGFTIVELVVVVAVIAILAAVLIPTFSGVIRKANIASDTAVAKNLNEAAIIADADTFEEAIAAVREAGYYLANLNAKADQCYFVWEDDSNQFVLYDLKNSKVLYSNTKVDGTPDASWCFAVSNSTVAAAVKAKLENVTIKNTAGTIDDVKDTIAAGGEVTIYVDESIFMDQQNTVTINNANSDITLSLGSSVVAGTIETAPFQAESGELTIEGGVITAAGTGVDADGNKILQVAKANGGTVNVIGTTIENNSAIIAVAAYNGGKLNIKDANMVVSSCAIESVGGGEVVVENTNITCRYRCFFSSANEGVSSILVKSGNYTVTEGNLFYAIGGTITVEGGTFNNTDENAKNKMFSINKTYSTGKIIIKGGTFDGIAFEDLTKENILDMSRIVSSDVKPAVTQLADGSWEIKLP